MNNVLETDLNIAHELRILKADFVQLHGNLISIKSDVASIRNDVLTMKAQVSSVLAGIEQLTCSLLGRQLGEVQLLPENVEVKSDSDQDHPTTPPVCSTSRKNTSSSASPSGHVDTAATDSELNLSEVTFKHDEMVTYKRNEKQALDSPQNPIKLFNFFDTTLEDNVDSQETQDPTTFVADTRRRLERGQAASSKSKKAVMCQLFIPRVGGAQRILRVSCQCMLLAIYSND